MTYKVSLEALGQLGADGFATMVHNRVLTLKEYDAHEATVRAHAANPDMPENERWTLLAVPVAPAEVDAAIKRVPQDDGTTDFVADYEIVGPSFEVKKSRLFQKVSEAEGAAINAVVAPGKIRSFQFREHDVRKSDRERYQAALNEAKDPSKLMAFDEFGMATRPEADTRFLEEQASREDQRQEIMRHAAGLHSDIEDLTPETIDAWEMKPFNG